jgi:type I restriction enzyme, S subunit
MRDGWVEITLSEIFRLNNKKLGSHQAEPSVFAVSKYEGVILASDFFGKRIASKKLDGYKTLHCGDWVYSTIHIDEGSIALNHFSYMGVVSPMYTTMTWISDLNLPEYFELLLRSPDTIAIYGQNAQGSINRRRSLSFERFSQIKFLVPPLAEQKRIVDLISSVDSYIKVLQQQIDKARKSRKAVLHELITKGGDGWVDFKFKDVAKVFKGKLPKGKNELRIGLPYLTANYLRSNSADFWIENLEGAVIAEQGECLILWDGAGAGDLFQAQNGVVSSTMAVVKSVNDSIFQDFLTLLISTKADYIKETCRGTTVPHVSPDAIENMNLIIPPLTEQKRIVEIISVFDNQIEALDSTIAKTQNLRSALLSDLFSGNHEIPKTYDKLIGAA